MLLLKNFVFKYFLDVARINNPRDWSQHYGMFKRWLGEQYSAHRKNTEDGKLAVNTCNNIIRALNAYITYLEHDPKSGFSYKSIPRCPMLEKKPNRKSLGNVLTSEEELFVFSQIMALRLPSGRRTNEEGYEEFVSNANRMRKLHAYFFQTMIETGLRINECIGLSLGNVVFSEIENDTLKRALKSEGIDHYGFINLKDQPSSKGKLRNKKNQVIRKPLKGRDSISPECNRIIPIMSEQLAKMLLELFNEQAALFKKGVHGANATRQDYLLFDGVTKNSFSAALRLVYDSEVFQKKFGKTLLRKTSHDLRHTFCTRMVAQTKGNPFLAKHILGHSDFKMVENYSHIWQQIVNDQKVNEQIDSHETLSVEKLRKF